MNLVLPFVVAFAGTLALTPVVRLVALRLGLVATPREDRWHDRPTALLGGTAIFGGFVAGVIAVLAIAQPDADSARVLGRGGVGILAAATMMFIVGLVDDRLQMRPATKLIFQALAAAIVVSVGVLYPVSSWPIVNILVTFFWFLGLTNALNLLDNMDGVAVGVAGVAAFFLAATFAWEGAWVLAAICLALAGAALGFLPYNFHRASIFMGDSGSLFLGALLAGLGAAYPATAPPSIVAVLFVPALIVIIPIADTSLVTLSRTLAGRPISHGGRDHTSHRLIAMGLNERQVALLLYGFAVIGGGLALLLRVAEPRYGMLIFAVFLVVLLIFAAYLGRMHTYSPRTERPNGAVTVLVSHIFYKRRASEVVLDLLLFAVAYQGAYLLRFDGSPPPEQAAAFEASLAMAVVAKSVAFGVMGVYRGTWHQINTADVHRILKATLLGSLLTVAALVFFNPDAIFARTVFAIDGILVLLLAIGARASFRSIDLVRHQLGTTGEPTLIYGAAHAGELVVRDLIANPERELRPVGFIDDDPAKLGRLVYGLPVLGSLQDLKKLVFQRKVRTLILAMKGLSAERAAELRQQCEGLPLELVQLRLELPTVDIDDLHLEPFGGTDRLPPQPPLSRLASG